MSWILFLPSLSFSPVMDHNAEINALTNQTENLECSDNSGSLSDTLITPVDNEHTIVAKILSDKNINMGAFTSSIIRAWSPKKRVTSNTLHPNLMAFIFEDKDDAEKILNLSWSFRDLQVVVQKWPDDKALEEINMNICTFWIHAFGIPVCFINLQTAQQIGDTVGKFVKADLQSKAQKWKKSLRIQVQLDIRKPLTSSVLLACLARPKFLIEIRYERLSDFAITVVFWDTKFNHVMPMVLLIWI